jgi:hypothetical protein
MLSSEWVARKRTFGSFTMRNPAFEIISKLESIKSIFSIWHEQFAFLTSTKRKVSTVQKRWNIRDILQKCWKGFSGLGQHVVVIINQLLGTFLDNGTCMQWRWFCKFPHPHQKTFVTWVQAGARQHKHHRFPTLECLEPKMTWAEVSIFLL